MATTNKNRIWVKYLTIIWSYQKFLFSETLNFMTSKDQFSSLFFYNINKQFLIIQTFFLADILELQFLHLRKEVRVTFFMSPYHKSEKKRKM